MCLTVTTNCIRVPPTALLAKEDIPLGAIIMVRHRLEGIVFVNMRIEESVDSAHDELTCGSGGGTVVAFTLGPVTRLLLHTSSIFCVTVQYFVYSVGAQPVSFMHCGYSWGPRVALCLN